MQYQDIQGAALINGRHTNHQYKRYIVSGAYYYSFCFYCDYSNWSLIEPMFIEPMLEAASCSHDYQAMVSVGNVKWCKCTKCYKIIKSNFIVNSVSGGLEIAPLQEYSGTSLTIPVQIGGENIVSIGEHVFQGNTSLQQVVFPSNSQVTTIKSWAFHGCSSLTSMNIPSSVEEIGWAVFVGTPSEPFIDWHYNHNMNAYYDNTSNFGSHVKRIFISNSLTTATLPYGMKTLRENTLIGGDSITALIFPVTLTRIEDYAFANCPNLTQLSIPSTITYLSSRAFSSSSVSSIIWYYNEGISGFRSQFDQLVTEIVIEDDVNYIRGDTFEYLPNLVSFIVSPDNQYFSSVDGVLYNKNQTELLQVPMACQNVVMPNTITSFPSWAFNSHPRLEIVFLSLSVTSIPESAFASCSNLVEVYVMLDDGYTVVNCGVNAFNGTNQDLVIYVPERMHHAYYQDSSWQTYQNKLQPVY
ncbi:MAG: leucine-rich repeat domain-containing protein [Erysipelotrichaceae bacterium]|nr:leucine-rich repeat domain-containing protein [Erysipelotrichaceae bacterium]